MVWPNPTEPSLDASRGERCHRYVAKNSGSFGSARSDGKSGGPPCTTALDWLGIRAARRTIATIFPFICSARSSGGRQPLCSSLMNYIAEKVPAAPPLPGGGPAASVLLRGRGRRDGHRTGWARGGRDLRQPGGDLQIARPGGGRAGAAGEAPGGGSADRTCEAHRGSRARS